VTRCLRCRAPIEQAGNGRPRLYCSAACRLAAARRRRRGSVHFSSASPEWSTPQELFDELDAEFGFELDVCATAGNAKCERYFTQVDDGLAQVWRGVCWMNPPYGDGIGAWMRKAHESSLLGATVVCLIPARTDTRWWQDIATVGEVRFVRGRLRFGGTAAGAPFPSAVVIFRPQFRNGFRIASDDTEADTKLTLAGALE
jgi:phage N-6-adenine-methyltransferase